MNALTVSVDYADLLSICMPYNRHHFRRWLIVTTPQDTATQAVALANGGELFLTEAFYAGGAFFNKYLCQELALDHLGRDGWLALVDADVCWPKVAHLDLIKGTLTTPYRRLLPTIPKAVPAEEDWPRLPLQRCNGWREWIGCTQIFHASDPMLGPPPWHQVNWSHAGGGDSFFQAKWPRERKVRPGWECLHIGPECKNWCGRTSRRADGSVPEDAREKRAALRKIMRGRDNLLGVYDEAKYRHEKIK